MDIYNKTINVKTSKRCDMIDITRKVKDFVSETGIKDGQVYVHCPHTTAAITVNENADPAVVHDVLLTLDELIPQNRKGYRHGEGNSDAHVKSSLVGCTETILISGAKMVLGTWQGIYFCEFDGARSRKVNLQVSGQ